MAVQRERLKGEKTGEDSHRQFNTGWKTGCLWLDFRKVTTTDHDSAGNSVLVTAMFCKWCEMAGFKHNYRGKPTVSVCRWRGVPEVEAGVCQGSRGHANTHKEACR
jgi:hypothetical protein